jgi:hypothetical protein
VGVNPLFVRKGFEQYAGTLFGCQGAGARLERPPETGEPFSPEKQGRMRGAGFETTTDPL